MQPITLAELRSAIDGTWQGAIDDQPLLAESAKIERFVTDSRLVQPGDLFWAIRGEHCDGHDFLVEAFERGARCAVVDRRNEWSLNPTGTLLVVKHTLTALADLARWRRQRWQGEMICITGSVGKTTTRSMIHAVLSAQWHGHQSPHNFNNELGVPLTVVELQPDQQFAAVELGARQPGDIRTLAEIAIPRIGVITSVGKAHLERFGSLDAIIATKGELLAALPSDGLAILNGDDPATPQLRRMTFARVIEVGLYSPANYQASQIERTPDGWRFRVNGHCYELAVEGRHFIANSLMAIAIGRELGLSPERIAAGLQTFRPLPGRCRTRAIGPWTVIDDTYNASPGSMLAALSTLVHFPTKGVQNKVLVLGDMRELGTASHAEHRRLGQLIAASGVESLFVCGEYASHVHAGAVSGGLPARSIQVATDSAALSHLIVEAVRNQTIIPGDVLLVKGSRSTRMESVIDALERLHAERMDAAACQQQRAA